MPADKSILESKVSPAPRDKATFPISQHLKLTYPSLLLLTSIICLALGNNSGFLIYSISPSWYSTTQ